MPFLLIFFLFPFSLLAGPKELSSFHSPFIQTIIDDTKKKIVYCGEVWASTPQNALWIYKKPIQKSVYINGTKLTLLEPLLEQATIKTLDDEIDFIQILKKAKLKSGSLYTANVKGQTYTIDFANERLNSIRYTDEYENHVTIEFTNPEYNVPIDGTRYKTIIPSAFDIIRG